MTATVQSVTGNAGLIEARVRRETGRVVSVYNGEGAGMDTDEGTHPFSTVCENHGHIISHATLPLARWHAVNPLGWCEQCMDEQEGGR